MHPFQLFLFVTDHQYDIKLEQPKADQSFQTVRSLIIRPYLNRTS